MIRKITGILCLLILLLSVNLKSLAQRITNNQIFYQMGVKNETALFLYYSHEYFSKNKIAEIYFVNADTAMVKEFGEDTIFYGFRRNGKLQYERTANIYQGVPPAPIQFLGYDTTFINKNCKTDYDCSCIPDSLFESTYCDTTKRFRFTRSYNFHQYTFYAESELPVNEIIVHLMPDLRLAYKIVYVYNKTNRLIKTKYYWLSPAILPELNKPFPSDKFSLDFAGEKRFEYDKSGRLKTVNTYFINDSTKKEQLLERRTFVYTKSLLSKIIYKNFLNDDYSYAELVRYAFY